MVIYNGESPWRAPLRLEALIDVEPGSTFHDFVPKLRYYLVDELRFGADDLKAGSSILLNILRLEQCEGGWEAVECIEAIAKALEQDEDGSVIDAVADFLNTARLPLEGVEGDFHRILREDTVLLYKRARQWEERFKQEGMSQGRKQGRRQGLLQGKRDAIARILSTRFGTIENALQDALGTVDDGEELDALTTAAVTLPSLEAFKAKLGGER